MGWIDKVGMRIPEAEGPAFISLREAINLVDWFQSIDCALSSSLMKVRKLACGWCT